MQSWSMSLHSGTELDAGGWSAVFLCSSPAWTTGELVDAGVVGSCPSALFPALSSIICSMAANSASRGADMKARALTSPLRHACSNA